MEEWNDEHKLEEIDRPTYERMLWGDRYLVDVFILPGCRDPHQVAAKGKLLNQMLLDEGLAEVWGK